MRLKTNFLFITFFSLALTSFGADWRPVTPEELALKQSKSDPNAVRFKIFNDHCRGADRQNAVLVKN